MIQPRFLTFEEVLAIHESRLQRYGGSSGVRDASLVQSAIANVEATFGGEFLHATIFEMGAAYLYGLCRNHGFVDGNKRVALASALVFLRFNAVKIDSPADSLYDLVIGVAEGRVTKEQIASFFESHAV